MQHLFKNISLTAAAFIMSSAAVFAEGPKPPSSMSNPFVVLMVIVIFFLALIIAILARVLIGAALVKSEKEKEAKKNKQAAISTVTIVVLLLLTVTNFAQDKTADATAALSTATSFDGLSATAFYLLSSVAFLEVIIILAMLIMLRSFVIAEKKAVALVGEAAVVKPKISWWDRANKFKPITEEASIDLGHDYDGIRELDNRLPPWWLYGFYCTIIFAVIYLWRFHVAHTAPLSHEEFQIAMAEAEEQKAEYLKKAANNVDETTVKLLTDEASIAAGAQVFETNCFPCHGKLGEGGVGPNLTDDYWLHGGSIKDVFKTIKYGWPDKGMKSWQDDFSPVQIQQLSSFVKSLHGTNPPNAKAPQGNLFKEDAAGAGKDSTNAATAVKDSTTTKNL